MLLERTSEIAAIRAALEVGSNGDGALLAIQGPAGVGKTRLLDSARELAGDLGMRVLVAHGGELERDFAYGVVRQLFEPLLARASAEEHAALLGGPAALAAVLFDEARLAEALARVEEGSFAIPHGLFWLAVNATERIPLLIAVDDLHWADQPSLRALAYLARRLEGLPIVLAVSLRQHEPGGDPLVIASIAAAPQARRIQPRPLSEPASHQVVQAAFGVSVDPAFSRTCHDECGGNPFLLRELTRSLAADGIAPTRRSTGTVLERGAQAVSDWIGLRLSGLGQEVARFAEAAAVLGDGTPIRRVAQLACLESDSAFEAAATLARIDVLRPAAAVEFVHPLVRAAVYARARQDDRERLHGAAARLLVGAAEAPERVAAHLMHVAPAGDPATVETLRGAATRALAAGGADAAVAYLRRALEEPPPAGERGAVLCALGCAEALVKGPDAVAHLRDAVGLITDLRDRVGTAEALARALYFDGRALEAVDVCREAIVELGERDATLRRRLEAIVLLAAIMEPSLNAVASEFAQRARDEPGAADFPSHALAALVAYRDARAGDASAIGRAERALAGGRLLAEEPGGAPFILASLVLAMADSERALERYTAGLKAARAIGSRFAIAANEIFSGHAHLVRGELAEAVAHGQAGLDVVAEVQIGIGPPWAAAYVAGALMEQGELQAAERALARIVAPDPLPDSAVWHWYLDAQAQRAMHEGNLTRALSLSLEGGRRFEAIGGRNPAFMPWRSRAALCLAGLGNDPQRARALANEELDAASAWGAPRALGAALRALGLVDGGDRGLQHLQEAIDVLEPSTARLELARALTDLGAALRRSNLRYRARTPLRRASEIAYECGATALLARARTELRACGARPRALVAAGGDTLTPSERRVAELAARGLSNKEIAQQLVVAPKTVETHLGSAYRKLDIRARGQLDAALADASSRPRSREVPP